MPSAPARLVSDIDLDVDLRDAAPKRPMVEFRCSGSSLTVEDKTLSRIENIRIRGVTANPDTVIKWSSMPIAKTAIELSPFTFNFARLDNFSSNVLRRFPGCYLVNGPARRIFFAQGLLSDPVNSIAADLSAFTNQASVLHLRVWAFGGNAAGQLSRLQRAVDVRRLRGRGSGDVLRAMY
jgi:hypothetical protein